MLTERAAILVEGKNVVSLIPQKTPIVMVDTALREFPRKSSNGIDHEVLPANLRKTTFSLTR